MSRPFFETTLVFSLLALALLCGNGCADVSVTMQSNKDLEGMHQVKRLYVIIDQGVLEKQPASPKIKEHLKSKVLAASLRECLSNTPVQLEFQIINPLALSKENYEAKITEYHADAVLVIKLKSVLMDQFGGCPKIYYDALLLNQITQKPVWRAIIENSGNPAAMNHRMQRMAEAIVAQLRADGFIESQ